MTGNRILHIFLVMAILLAAMAAPLIRPASVQAAAPDTPVNVSPAAGATGVSLMPTLSASAFSDLDGNGQAAAQWFVNGLTYNVYDAPFTTFSVPSGAGLEYGNTYSWQVRYQDDTLLFPEWSAWSTLTSFTTAQAPNAAFTASATSAEVGDTITFTNTSSGGVAPLSYNWAFGDGGTSTAANPTHSYSAAGTFTVTLTVTDDAGGTDTATGTITITAALAANFTAAPASVIIGQTVTFTNSSTGGTTPYTYSWAFGDGGTSTAANPTHTYTAAGTFTVTLTVTDAAAKTDQETATITVAVALAAGFSTENTTVIVGQAVTFTNTSTGGVAPLKYQWDFGDGGTSTQQSPQHTYGVSGEYTVKLVVTDSSSVPNTDTETKTDYVKVTSGLQADFSADRQEVALGQPVQFFGFAAGGAGTVTFEWDFESDGTVDSTLQNPSYIYSSPNIFSVTLTAKAGKETSQVNKPGYITVTSGLLADFAADNTNAVVGQAVRFTNLSGGGIAPLTYQWDFNSDGTWDSTVQSPSYTYSAAGSYRVSLKVTDSKGNTDTEKKEKYITVFVLPQTEFTASATTVVPGQTVTFTGSSSGGTPPLTYQWDFNGDDTIDSTSQTATYSYETAGIFTVSLTITDAGGNVDKETKIGYISVGNVAIAPHAIPAEGGTIQTADGRIMATFPAGAYDGEATLTMLEVTPSAAPKAPEGYRIGSACFTVEATDANGRAIASLSRPATITMKYTAADLSAAGGKGTNLVLAYYNPATAKWAIETTAFNETNQTLSTTTTHFSTWAVMVKTGSGGLPWWAKVLIILAVLVVVAIVVWRAFTMKNPERWPGF